jgi:large subunit ribosomal protein L18
MSKKQNWERRLRRKKSIRRVVNGDAGRPRLTVSRSLKHIYAQAVDDETGRTLASASSLNDELVTSMIDAKEAGLTVESSKAVGKAIAQRLQEQKIDRVIFDRNGYLYHGRIKAVADGARDAGLKF